MGRDHTGKFRSHCQKCPAGNCDDYEGNDAAFENKLVFLRYCLTCQHVPGDHIVVDHEDTGNAVTPVTPEPDSLNVENAMKRKSDVNPTDSDNDSCTEVSERPAKKKNRSQNVSRKGPKKGPTRKDDQRLKILREMDEPDYSPDIVEGLTADLSAVTDIWEDLLRETAEHYEGYGLGNTTEYSIVGNVIFNLYPIIADIKPVSNSNCKKPSTSTKKNQPERPAWWYFCKCLSDFNRKNRRRMRNCSIASTVSGRFNESELTHLEPVLPKGKRRQDPGDMDFSNIKKQMGELNKLYAAKVKDYKSLEQLIKETFPHRSKLIAGGSVASTMLQKNYQALKDPKLSEMDAFDDFFLIMHPKENFLTIFETKEEYNSMAPPSPTAVPRLKAFHSNETMLVTLFIGDFALNECQSLAEGLLNLVLAVHLFRKDIPLNLGNSYVVLESFALGFEAKEFEREQENYYRAMLNTLPPRTENTEPASPNHDGSEDENSYNPDEEQ